jgi:hypothetical protein
MAARKRQSEVPSARLHRTLSPPGVFLVRMFVFVALVSLVAAILSKELLTSFNTNPFLNGGIIGVLLVGVIYMFGQVLRLFPEIRWVNAFRIADPGIAIAHQPVLLAPMATMLRDRTGSLSLTTNAMRTIMDSIGSRLDEARDTGRYLVGLLVFLGLLGTFWGLLDTIQAVGRTIAALDTRQTDSGLMFEELKQGLAAPLRGMGTAFASSLLGLAGSLVLGFLDLQASQAHNRFYNELEEWLSGITDLTPAEGGAVNNDNLTRTLSVVLRDLQHSIDTLGARIDAPGSLGGVGPDGRPQIAGATPAGDTTRELAQGVHQLVSQLRNEQTIVRQWLDEQSSQAASRHDDVTQRLADVKIVVERKAGGG